MTELVIILCVVGVVWYVHKVGLPTVVKEIRDAKAHIAEALKKRE